VVVGTIATDDQAVVYLGIVVDTDVLGLDIAAASATTEGHTATSPAGTGAVGVVGATGHGGANVVVPQVDEGVGVVTTD